MCAQGPVAASTLLLTYTTPFPLNCVLQPREGEWQYSATMLSWRELKYLGFDTGSGLENKDEIHDALEVSVWYDGNL